MNDHAFIPALCYKWLTPFYDKLLGVTFPEGRIKQALINNIDLRGSEKILDHGTRTATLPLMLKRKFPDLDITGIDVDEDVFAAPLCTSFVPLWGFFNI